MTARCESPAFNHRPQPESVHAWRYACSTGIHTVFCISGCGVHGDRWTGNIIHLFCVFPTQCLEVWYINARMGKKEKKNNNLLNSLPTPPEKMCRGKKFLGVQAMERQTCVKTTRRARRNTGVLAAAAQREADAWSSSLYLSNSGTRWGWGVSLHLGRKWSRWLAAWMLNWPKTILT